MNRRAFLKLLPAVGATAVVLPLFGRFQLPMDEPVLPLAEPGYTGMTYQAFVALPFEERLRFKRGNGDAYDAMVAHYTRVDDPLAVQQRAEGVQRWDEILASHWA